MKRVFSLLALLAVQVAAFAQTVTFKPNPALGDNTIVMTTYGCSLAGYPTPAENFVFGSVAELAYLDWTYFAIGCSHGTTRSLLRFNQVSTIPPGATILSAELRLYGVPTSGNYGNSTFPGSPYAPLTNEGYVYQIAGPWNISTVTWNTQPPVAGPRVAIAPTTSRFRYNTTINVTTMVKNMVASGANYGFMLQLQNENYYRGVIMAGNNNPDPSLWPELVVTYLACDPTFTYTPDPINSYILNLNANTVMPGMVYQWVVDGTNVGTGGSLNHTFPGPGTYSVCLRVVKNQMLQCEQCVDVYIPVHRTMPQPPVKANTNLPDGKSVQQAASRPLPVGDMPVTKSSMIAPNPTHDGWNISIDNPATSGQATITLYDINGKVISKQTKELNNGNNKIYQPATNLAPGTYMIEYTNGQTSWKEKVVKQ